MRSFIPVIIASVFLFASCASDRLPHSSPDYEINEAVDAKTLSSQSFIFIRLYDVTYDRLLRSGNLIRRPIRILGKADNGVAYVHSALSLTLNDGDFIGLSLAKRRNMAYQESIKNPDDNGYMSTMNAEKSRCLVLALPCTELDYSNVQKVLEYIRNHDQTYGIRCNFAIPVRHWKNVDNYEHSRCFPIEYSFDSIPLQKELGEIFDGKLFVCSTIIAVILQQSVERYRVDFMINGINPLGFTPVDLTELNGAVPLFECGFKDYDEAVKSVSEKYPVFKKYVE